MAKFIVCPECRGEGSILNPEIAGNGYTHDEWEDLGEDFRDNLEAGVYNVNCPCCCGQRVTTRSQHAAYLGNRRETRADRLLALQESGIYPGHRDYF